MTFLLVYSLLNQRLLPIPEGRFWLFLVVYFVAI